MIRNNIIAGMILLAVLVLSLFLRDFRSTAIIAVSSAGLRRRAAMTARQAGQVLRLGTQSVQKAKLKRVPGTSTMIRRQVAW